MNNISINLNDHYFVAWLYIKKKKKYYINNDKIYIDIPSNEYKSLLEEYRTTAKPLLKKVRELVKELNSLTSKS